MRTMESEFGEVEWKYPDRSDRSDWNYSQLKDKIAGRLALGREQVDKL